MEIEMGKTMREFRIVTVGPFCTTYPEEKGMSFASALYFTVSFILFTCSKPRNKNSSVMKNLNVYFSLIVSLSMNSPSTPSIYTCTSGIESSSATSQWLLILAFALKSSIYRPLGYCKVNSLRFCETILHSYRR